MSISFPAWDKRSTAPNVSVTETPRLVLGCGKPGTPSVHFWQLWWRLRPSSRVSHDLRDGKGLGGKVGQG